MGQPPQAAFRGHWAVAPCPAGGGAVIAPYPPCAQISAAPTKAGSRGPTFQVPPLVVQHNVLAIEHLAADLTCKLLVPVLLLVFGEVAVSGEESETHLTLECLVICPESKQMNNLSVTEHLTQSWQCAISSKG